jgi:hypothetical protein
MVNFISPLLYPRERTSVSVEEEDGWAPETVGTFWRREKSLPEFTFCMQTCFLLVVVGVHFRFGVMFH